MKYFAAILGLMFWGILTLLFCVSIVGLVIFTEESYFDIPHKLLKVFEK